jgi:microcystin-dependent protein
MAQPYVGEIRMFAGNFAPAGWMLCQGQLLPISENETLFQLIGTTYGGDGQSTFALPNLQSRVPIHWGNGFQLAETGGVESVTLTVNQMAAHGHPLLATTAGQQLAPANNTTLASPTSTAAVAFPAIYGPGPTNTTISPATIGPTGGNQPHTNFQPTLAINYILSLFGLFPSPS